MAARALRAAATAFLVSACLIAWTGVAGAAQPFESYESAVAASEPAAQFRFSDPPGSLVLEDSVSGHTYTASNSGISLGGEGPFNGSGSGSFSLGAYASLPTTPLAGATAFTAEAWVKWSGGTTYNQPVFSFGSSSTNYMYLTPASSESGHLLTFEIVHPLLGSGLASRVTGPKPAANTWKYITVTEASGGTMTLYVNGVEVGHATAVWSPESLGAVEADYLGKSISTSATFAGSMSNVAFYTHALSASEVLNHYDEAEDPVDLTSPAISGTDKEGDTLKVLHGSWTGLTPIEYAYQWQRCESSCANIGGATAVDYTPTSGDVGKKLRVVVIASNATKKNGEATSAETATVAGVAPVDLAAPTIEGEAEEGQTLNATTGTWSGTPATRYLYQWEYLEGGTWKALSGATGSRYAVVEADSGHELRVTVTDENPAGAASASSAATAIVPGSPPSNTTGPSVSGEVREDSTLTGSAGTWAGSRPLTLAYQWERCSETESKELRCAAIQEQTGSSYTVGSADWKKLLRLRVIATNALGEASATYTTSAVAPLYSGTTLAGWGENGTGQLGGGYWQDYEEHSIPSFGLEDVVSVGGGYHQTIALLANGNVMGWGGNGSGQTGTDNRRHVVLHPTPVVWAQTSREIEERASLRPVENVRQIAVGGATTVGLIKKEGEPAHVIVWGGDQFGQLGNGQLNMGAGGKMIDTYAIGAEEVTTLPEEATQIAAGDATGYALLKGGRVYAWGKNTVGQLGIGIGGGKGQAKSYPQGCKSEVGLQACETVPAPVCKVQAVAGECPSPLEHVTRIWVRGSFVLAQLEGGEIVGWGDNVDEELGQGTGARLEINHAEQVLPASTGSKVLEVAVGGSFALARLEGGEVLGWGNDQWGELTEKSENLVPGQKSKECAKGVECVWTPTRIPALSSGVGGEEIAQMSAGTYAWTLVLTKGGKVYSVGHDGPFHQLGYTTGRCYELPKEPTKGQEHEDWCSRTLTEVHTGGPAQAVSAEEEGSMVILAAGAERPSPKIHLIPGRESIEMEWTTPGVKYLNLAKTWDEKVEALEEERETKAAEAEVKENGANEDEELAKTAGEPEAAELLGAAKALDEEAGKLRNEAEELHQEARKDEEKEDPWGELNEGKTLSGGQYEHCSPATPCRFKITQLEREQGASKTPLEPNTVYDVQFKTIEEGGPGGETRGRFGETTTSR